MGTLDYLNKNLPLAIRYANGNSAKAQQIMRDNYKNIVAIKVFFQIANTKRDFDSYPEQKTFYGLLLLLVSLDLEKLVGISSLLEAGISDAFSSKIFDYWSIFEQHTVGSYVESVQQKHGSEMENAFVDYLGDVGTMKSFLEFVRHDSYEDITQSLSFVFSLYFMSSQSKIRLNMEMINPLEYHKNTRSKIVFDVMKMQAQESRSVEVVKKSANKLRRTSKKKGFSYVVASAHPVFSQKKGLPASRIRSGEYIDVVLDKNAELSKVILKSLGLSVQSLDKPIALQVESVKPNHVKGEVVLEGWVMPKVLIRVSAKAKENIRSHWSSPQVVKRFENVSLHIWLLFFGICVLISVVGLLFFIVKEGGFVLIDG